MITPSQDIISELEELLSVHEIKLFLKDITSLQNNWQLSKKWNVGIHFIVCCRKFNEQIAHHVIASVLKSEQQKEEPVRLWYGNVA